MYDGNNRVFGKNWGERAKSGWWKRHGTVIGETMVLFSMSCPRDMTLPGLQIIVFVKEDISFSLLIVEWGK